MLGDTNASTPPIEGYAPPPQANPIAAMGFAIGLYYFSGIATWMIPSMIPDKLKSVFSSSGESPIPAIMFISGLATPPLLLLYFLSRKN